MAFIDDARALDELLPTPTYSALLSPYAATLFQLREPSYDALRLRLISFLLSCASASSIFRGFVFHRGFHQFVKALSYKNNVSYLQNNLPISVEENQIKVT